MRFFALSVLLIANHASALTLREKIGQLVFIKLQGESASAEIRHIVRDFQIGGAIAFADSIRTVPQVKALTASLQGASAIPLLLAIDQEGGRVDRFRAVYPPAAGARELGKKSAAAIRAAGRLAAARLREAGFNVDLAPVIDSGNAGALKGRTFSDDPDRIAADARLFLEGLQAEGDVSGVLKHFPGVGRATVDPHFAMPRIEVSSDTLKRDELRIYAHLLATAKVRAIMVANATYPLIDPKLPASLSPILIGQFLRRDLAFDGVVMTDCLSVPPIRRHHPLPDAALQALIAGADLVTGPVSYVDTAAVVAKIEAAVRDHSISEERLNASVRRVLEWKASLGLLNSTGRTALSALRSNRRCSR